MAEEQPAQPQPGSLTPVGKPLNLMYVLPLVTSKDQTSLVSK